MNKWISGNGTTKTLWNGKKSSIDVRFYLSFERFKCFWKFYLFFFCIFRKRQRICNFLDIVRLLNQNRIFNILYWIYCYDSNKCIDIPVEEFLVWNNILMYMKLHSILWYCFSYYRIEQIFPLASDKKTLHNKSILLYWQDCQCYWTFSEDVDCCSINKKFFNWTNSYDNQFIYYYSIREYDEAKFCLFFFFCALSPVGPFIQVHSINLIVFCLIKFSHGKCEKCHLTIKWKLNSIKERERERGRKFDEN